MSKLIFKHIACGETLPVGNKHSVSVSMPTLQDVIDYEEKTPEIFTKIKSAYPRFVRHQYITQLSAYLNKKYKLQKNEEAIVVSSEKVANIICKKFSIVNNINFKEDFGIVVANTNSDIFYNIMQFIQHTGCVLSSRFAQDYLVNIGILSQTHNEQIEIAESAISTIKSVLGDAYNQKSQNVGLAPSGMNAIYAVTKAIQEVQAKKNRHIFVQLGWLYTDTMSIVKHYQKQYKIFLDVSNLNELESFLSKSGNSISAIITEVPTNPQLKCVNLNRLRNLCDNYNIPLIIDSTLATAYNANLKKYANIFIESLTKFACGNADVLMGAVIMNSSFPTISMQEEIFKNLEPIYIKDAQRLAYQIKEYKNRVEKISLNTKKLVNHFKKAPYINQLHFYVNSNGIYSGVISVTFNKDFESVYNTLNFAKGPSLGTEFTLLMPYVYLAHYDYIKTVYGQNILKNINLPINLLRISVGTENIDNIIAEFDRVIIL